MAAEQEETQKMTFTVKEKIGEGTYGIVYRIVDSVGNEYAFKRVMSQLTKQPGAYTESLREADILNRLNKNPRIVHLKMVSIGCPPTDRPLSPLRPEDDGPKLCDDLFHFLFENAKCNLRSWLKRNELSFNQLKQFMVDILLGSESIALSGILHRDLNPSNILIYSPTSDELESDLKDLKPLPSSFYRAKICDFGLALPNVRDGRRTPGTVTPWYRAPEIIGEDGYYDSKSDAWSLGCIFYEILFKTPFIGKVNDTKNELVSGIFRNSLYKLSDYEIRTVLGCEKRKHNNPPKPIRGRIIGSKPLRTLIESRNGKKSVNHAQPMDVASTQIVDEITNLISSLLIVDPRKRASCSAVLDMPFFDSHREYIRKFREAHPPRYSYEYEYDIQVGEARDWAAEYMISIYNQRDDHEWYTHRVLFHAIDLFDRDLRYHLRSGKPFRDRTETELHFFSCLYISIRFFSTLRSPIEVGEILPNHLYRVKKNFQLLAELELTILLDVIEYSFYRYTIYEAIYESETKIDRELLIKRALDVITKSKIHINGKTPTDIAYKVISDATKNDE